MATISVIIPTFNSAQFIGPCLDSISSQGYPLNEIVVVDNNSCDNTVDFIKNKYPAVIVAKNDKNLGVCKARNQAIALTSGDWVLALDCDVVLEKNFFCSIAEEIKNLGPKIGAIQPKLLKYDKKTIYSTGIYFSFMRRFYDVGRGQIDKGQFNFPKNIFGVCSAAAIYRRQMLEDTKELSGYFDERFFFLVEDVDLAWRAKHKGWRAKYCPAALAYHHGDSCGLDKKSRQYLCFRNRYYSITKNEGLFRYSMRLLPVLFYDVPRALFLIFSNKLIHNKSTFN